MDTPSTKALEHAEAIARDTYPRPGPNYDLELVQQMATRIMEQDLRGLPLPRLEVLRLCVLVVKL